MTDPAVEQEIITLVREWREAIVRRDRAALERILADDFLIAGWRPGGQVADRETYLEDCLRPVDVERPTFNDDQWKVRVYGDTAIVNYLFTWHGLVGGQDWSGTALLTNVWLKRDGRWQVVAAHSSLV